MFLILDEYDEQLLSLIISPNQLKDLKVRASLGPLKKRKRHETSSEWLHIT